MLLPRLPVLLTASIRLTSNYTGNAPVVVCDAGQCLQGYSNTTIGVTLSVPGSPAIRLLPGQYTSTSNPQLLHNALTSSSVSLSPSPGFDSNATILSLPLNVLEQPGLTTYTAALYSGANDPSAFTPIPSAPIPNSSSLVFQSLSLSLNTWIAVNASSNPRLIVWDSVPDISQLPSVPANMRLLSLESSTCSPSCASSGICTSSGVCACLPGFVGAACEKCGAGLFGPRCNQTCPAGCAKCDDGLGGSGRCLDSGVTPGACGCVNGACNPDGSCACTTGFVSAGNGTKCAQCAGGFFLTPAGDCSICAIGCSACADRTGTCTACKTGFTPDANDATKCDPVPSVTSANVVCPDGAFASGASCVPCSSACRTCTAGASTDCVRCATGTYLLNGTCVSADANGVCKGSSMIANNNKLECDACGAKCTSCKIPGFNSASTINELQCTSCVTGFAVSNGTCVSSCPSRTFPLNGTCTACDSSCSTCAGSSSFCLSCHSNQLALSGQCISTCPPNTFLGTSNASCSACHPDCAACSGPAFDQCTSCSPSSSRPVLKSGRCLPTCSKTEFFDITSSTCHACDGSCSSCSGSGPGQCLACADPSQVLRAGSCVAAGCAAVVSGLGACLSELVDVPSVTSGSPLPSASGIDAPTTGTANTTRRRLAWWEILLMVLGCVFILVMVLWLLRRRAKNARAKNAHRDKPNGLCGRLCDTFRSCLRKSRSRPVYELRLDSTRKGADASRPPIMHPHLQHPSRLSVESAPSIYSQMTSYTAQAAQPRQPVRADRKFSVAGTSLVDPYYHTTAPYMAHKPTTRLTGE
ncbi:unnamed protein product [Mycena citricolor]|uniref:EGF-like domain-containing protein n=1 Tax=Mycena citricolor TaxID=2018698 RepID=A0AAD2HBB3_9AGAR|nr:unnamed protein product [Mycena citricolor]